MRSYFSQYYFNDTKEVVDGVTKLELYHRKFDPKRKVFLKDPVHDWTSHCADAIRTEAAAEQFDDAQSWGHTEMEEVPNVYTDYSILG